MSEDFSDPWSNEEFNAFGDLDVDDVPDDPFYIAPARYNWRVTKAQIKQHEIKSEEVLVAAANNGEPKTITKAYFTVVVDEPNSEFHGKPLPVQFTMYPWLKRAQLEVMPDPERKSRITANMSNLKVFLKGIGCSEDEVKQIRPNTIASITIGKLFSAKLSVNNTADGRTFKNLGDFKEATDAEIGDIGGWLGAAANSSEVQF